MAPDAGQTVSRQVVRSRRCSAEPTLARDMHYMGAAPRVRSPHREERPIGRSLTSRTPGGSAILPRRVCRRKRMVSSPLRRYAPGRSPLGCPRFTPPTRSLLREPVRWRQVSRQEERHWIPLEDLRRAASSARAGDVKAQGRSSLNTSSRCPLRRSISVAPARHTDLTIETWLRNGEFGEDPEGGRSPGEQRAGVDGNIHGGNGLVGRAKP